MPSPSPSRATAARWRTEANNPVAGRSRSSAGSDAAVGSPSSNRYWVAWSSSIAKAVSSNVARSAPNGVNRCSVTYSAYERPVHDSTTRPRRTYPAGDRATRSPGGASVSPSTAARWARTSSQSASGRVSVPIRSPRASNVSRSPTAGSPALCSTRWRSRIGSPSGPRGSVTSRWSVTGSSSEQSPAAANCRTAAAVNGCVAPPTLNNVSGPAERLPARSRAPNPVAHSEESGSTTATVTPGNESRRCRSRRNDATARVVSVSIPSMGPPVT